MSKVLRCTASVLINSLVAFIGTAILESPFYRLYQAHGVGQMLAKEAMLSGLGALLLGYFIFRIWRPVSARWVWVPGLCWITFRTAFVLISFKSSSILATEHLSLWVAFSGVQCSGDTGAAGCVNWLLFTLPALRLCAYSAGATVCAKLGHEGYHSIVNGFIGRFDH